VLGNFTTTFQVQPGDCLDPSSVDRHGSVYSTWQRLARDAGRLVCFAKAASDVPFNPAIGATPPPAIPLNLYWSDDASGLLAIVMGHGSYADLVSWWQEVGSHI
jgi:hypothetical protein